VAKLAASSAKPSSLGWRAGVKQRVMDTEHDRQPEPPAQTAALDQRRPALVTPAELPSIPGVLEAVLVEDVVVVRFLATRICDEEHEFTIRRILTTLADRFSKIVFDFSRVEIVSTSFLGVLIRTYQAFQQRWGGLAGIRDYFNYVFRHCSDDVESAIKTHAQAKRKSYLAACGLRQHLREVFVIVSL